MSPRPRRAKAAPAVLFQPPEPDRPLPRQALRSSPAPSAPPEDAAPASDLTAPPAKARPTPDQASPPDKAAPAAGQAGPPEPAAAADQANPPARGRQSSAGASARTPTARATPRKTTALKATKPTPAAPAVPAEAGTTDSPTSQAPTPATTTAPPQKATPAGPTRKAPASKTAASPGKATPSKAASPTTQPATPTTPARRAASPTKRAAAPPQSAPPTEATPAPQPTASPPQSAPPTEATPAPQPTASPPQSAPPTEATPAPQPTATPALVGDLVPALGRTPESELRAVAARVLDHPGFAPELLALAAVRSLGPGAGEWAARLRDRYPDAPADGLARLVTRRYVRAAGAGGATAALAGFFAPLAELASVLWTQANLVLHLAAVYGRDPAHPDRAVELLVLTQVHPDEASARQALTAAQTAGDPVEGAWPRAAEAAWRLAAPLTAQAGGWVALRLVARLLPGAAVLAAALGDAAAADRLAARTVAVYRR
ncbi:hypothetical protein [Micromonospora sp. NPDC049204]|uniref:hypothetical protein n=1 Tax=Micromonospora sp. NPDC049204 TaxID=3154351 RepID=UPI0033C2FBC6